VKSRINTNLLTVYLAGNANDLYKLDLDQMTWTDLSKSVTGTAPNPRSSHGFSSLYGILYVFGGGVGGLRDGKTRYVARDFA